MRNGAAAIIYVMIEPIRATVIQMMPPGTQRHTPGTGVVPRRLEATNHSAAQMYAGGPVVNAFQDPPEMPPGNVVMAGVGVRAEEEEAPHR